LLCCRKIQLGALEDKIGSVEIAHSRAYWFRISFMWIKAFSNKISGKKERETHSLQFASKTLDLN